MQDILFLFPVKIIGALIIIYFVDSGGLLVPKKRKTPHRFKSKVFFFGK